MRIHFFLAILICGQSLVSFGSEVLLATVATIDKEVLTTRDVQISQVLDGLLKNEPIRSKKNEPIESLIEERLLFREAKEFYGAKFVDSNLDKTLSAVKKSLDTVAGWDDLTVSDKELRSILNLKAKARRLVKFKKDSAKLPVSDSEVEAEYKQNRIFYGSQSLEEVKEKIRAQKFKENFNRRVDSWFQILFQKYKVVRLTKGTPKQGFTQDSLLKKKDSR